MDKEFDAAERVEEIRNNLKFLQTKGTQAVSGDTLIEYLKPVFGLLNNLTSITESDKLVGRKAAFSIKLHFGKKMLTDDDVLARAKALETLEDFASSCEGVIANTQKAREG